MKYAIIKSGGKQIKCLAGESIFVEKIDKEGSFEIDQVLAIYDGKKLHIGKPLLEKSLVKVTILKQGKGKKIKILRTKQKSNWARNLGHRQPYTRLLIEEIILSGKSIDKASKPKDDVKKTDLKSNNNTDDSKEQVKKVSKTTVKEVKKETKENTSKKTTNKEEKKESTSKATVKKVEKKESNSKKTTNKEEKKESTSKTTVKKTEKTKKDSNSKEKNSSEEKEK